MWPLGAKSIAHIVKLPCDTSGEPADRQSPLSIEAIGGGRYVRDDGFW